jgi:hypothetical protein
MAPQRAEEVQRSWLRCRDRARRRMLVRASSPETPSKRLARRSAWPLASLAKYRFFVGVPDRASPRPPFVVLAGRRRRGRSARCTRQRRAGLLAIGSTGNRACMSPCDVSVFSVLVLYPRCAAQHSAASKPGIARRPRDHRGVDEGSSRALTAFDESTRHSTNTL